MQAGIIGSNSLIPKMNVGGSSRWLEANWD